MHVHTRINVCTCTEVLAQRKCTHLIAVDGIPSSSASNRIFFMATIWPVWRFLPLYTTPYVPSPIFSIFVKCSMAIRFYASDRIAADIIYGYTCSKSAKIDKLRLYERHRIVVTVYFNKRIECLRIGAIRIVHINVCSFVELRVRAAQKNICYTRFNCKLFSVLFT